MTELCTSRSLGSSQNSMTQYTRISPYNFEMSRSVRKAIEHAKQKKEHELRFTDEGISELATTYPELCKNE